MATRPGWYWVVPACWRHFRWSIQSFFPRSISGYFLWWRGWCSVGWLLSCVSNRVVIGAIAGYGMLLSVEDQRLPLSPRVRWSAPIYRASRLRMACLWVELWIG